MASRPFVFDVQKAIQSVAFLLRNEPARRMNYMRLLKVLYLVEREVIRESGLPLTGSKVVAMERGVVLDDVYSLIKSEHSATPEWSRFFQKDRYDLVMLDDPGIGRLSRFVRGKLSEVSEQHTLRDEWAMVDVTHQLPEWKKNDPEKSCKEIPLVDILEAMGISNRLQSIVDGAKADANASAFFHDGPFDQKLAH